MILAITSEKFFLRSDSLTMLMFVFMKRVFHLRSILFLYLPEKGIMIQPIWKSCFIDLGTEDSVEYVVSYYSQYTLKDIYSGKAWKRPGDSSIKVCINEICEDWLTNTFPSLSIGFNRNEMPVEFVIQTIDSSGERADVAKVRFVNDWSYDPLYDTEKRGFAAPINGRLDARQWLLWTGLDVSMVDVEVTLSNGGKFMVYVPVEISADFTADYNQDFAISVMSAGSGTAVFSPSRWGDVAKVVVNGVEYEVVQTCSKYVLYYLNAYGGWDSLLIEGAASEEDSLTRHTMSKTGVYDREKTNYLNEIEKKMTLHTSWMSDEQSLKMHHLLNSTDVYLHDLDKNVILPVILDNSSTPYKTFKGEGGKLVNYTIEATIAQTRRRR